MTRPICARLIIAWGAALAATYCAANAGAVTFQEIPGLIEANDVSDDGSTVVGTQRQPSGVNAVRWRRGEALDVLGDFPGGATYSEGLAISGDGSVVVGRGEYDRYQVVIDPFGDIATVQKKAAFRWTSETGLQSLHPYSRDTEDSTAGVITSDGETIFGVQGTSPFRWTESEGLQPAPITAADASSDGNVLVGQGVPPGGTSKKPLCWTPESGIQELPIPGGLSIMGDAPPLRVSLDGGVVWGNRYKIIDGTFHYHPYTWTEAGGYVPLLDDMPFGINIKFSDTNQEGSIFAGQFQEFDPDHIYRAILWSETSGIVYLDELLTTLGVDFSGWQLQRATGVSADGSTIVGRGYNPEGNASSWIVTLPMLNGDYNGDGLVDAADYTVWRDTLGSSQDLRADGNLNGVVDSADYGLWRTRFVSSLMASSNATRVSSVPEPSLLALLLAALVPLTLRPRS